MNTDKLGDAMDSWKGTVFGHLKCLLKNLYVFPMITNTTYWNHCHTKLYARLIRIPSDRILKTNVPFVGMAGNGTDDYFSDQKIDNKKCDIFLDPDTGIYYPRMGNANSTDVDRVGVNVINRLLKSNTDNERVIIVYSHRRERMQTLSTNLHNLRNAHLPRHKMFAIRGGHACLVFISNKNTRRICEMQRILFDLYNPVSPERTTSMFL